MEDSSHKLSDPNQREIAKEIKLDPRLTSFIKKDNSFLTRWSWDPNASKNELGSTSTKGENLSFPPESYFSHEVLVFPCLMSSFVVSFKTLGLWRYLTVASLVPLFTKVQDLRPEMENINITLKVVNVKKVSSKGHMPVTESLVGDETGIIILRAVGADKINRVKEGSTIVLHKAKIIMYRGSMRLGVCRAEDIEEAPPAAFTIKEDCNLSLIEYERIQVQC
ncbi:putative nucleic acid-binding protein [Medicago truncatula]|uniref:Putative nucleic acid-binding protein n=1 Tax=Medicago truncatula TaxID=3880 RepID=A0A396I0K8_MEDTR|nr:putative nucleic acid-binding protein [Medicago truncatula]